MVNLPERVGRYHVRGVLGSGGFATVYRAWDASLEREVALKVLHPHLATDPALRDRFLREGRALARVEHPNIVTVWEAGEEGGTAYLAMKLIAGRPLSDILAQTGPLPAGQVATVIEQVAAALGEVHARRLVHRDIKPENIMIEDGSNRAMLLDLGVARDLANASMTGGLIVGTLGYMAPEQAQAAGDVSPRTDVYQLGATAFALLTGRPPFSGDTIQVLDAVIRLPPPDLRALRPDIPEGVIAAISRALAKDARYRFPSTRDFAADLRAAVTPQPFMPPRGSGGGSAPASPSPRPFTAQPSPLAGGGASPFAANPSPPPFAAGPSQSPPFASGSSSPPAQPNYADALRSHGSPPPFPAPGQDARASQSGRALSPPPYPPLNRPAGHNAPQGATWVPGQTPAPGGYDARPPWSGAGALPESTPWGRPAGSPYAGFGRRAVAEMIDWILCFFVLVFLAAFLEYSTDGGTDTALESWLGWGGWLLGTGLYFAYLESRRRGATLGKLALGVAVRDSQGKPISFGRALARYAAKYLSMVTLLIGYLIAAGDAKRRTLHDRIAGTVVVPWKP